MISTPAFTKTKTGIGYSQNEASFEAGVEIASKALVNSSLSAHTLFWLFATPTHDVNMLMNGVRSIIGAEPSIIGGTTIGILTNDFLSYTGAMAGGGFISADGPFFNLFFEESIKDREFDAGKGLAQKISEADTPDDASILLFYDCVKFTADEGGPMLNLATPILEGFHSIYKNWPIVAGIGVVGDMNMVHPCSIWLNEKNFRHGLVGVTISGSLKMDTVILKGTRPSGGYHTITKAEHNIIYELDGKPALEVISRIMGSSVSWDEFPMFVTLGVNNGDKFGEYDEENYSSRVCLAIDKVQKSLIMFETDLKQGQEVQLMRRDIDFNYIQPQVDKLMSKLGNRKPVFAYYIDCVGRLSAYSGMQDEESLVMLKALGNIPCFGIFSGVEIGNVGTYVKALDWTGVLCLFSED